MAMRVSGINSGLDTDAIVQELVSAYSKKTEKYEKEQTKLSWKQDIWKSLNSKVYSFYTDVSKLKYSSAYSLRKTTVSDPTKASVSANGTTIGSQKLNILKTAQSAYLTGTKIKTKSGANAKSDTKLSDLGVQSDATIRVNTKNEDGESQTKDIKITKDMTISEFAKELSEAGLNANFDEDNGRLFISSKKSGANGDFSITAANTKEIPLFVTDPETGENVLQKDKNGKPLYETIDAKPEDIQAANTVLSFLGISQTWSQVSRRISPASDNVAVNENLRLMNLGYKDIDKVNENEYKDGSEIEVKNKIKVIEKDENGLNTEVEKEIAVGTLKINQYTSMKDIVSQLKDMGINASFEVAKDKETGKDFGFLAFHGQPNLTFSVADTDNNGKDILAKLALDQGYMDEKINVPTKINGQDAEIRLNGEIYNSSTNNFTINGLDINAQAVTGDGDENALTINVAVDTQGLYDKVKDFLTQYNNIINEITKLYNADSAYGYDPLTDDEKDSMSDREIEKWETKIKDSLLRRDSSLSSLMSSMINSMNRNISINGKSYNLTSFGIHTMGYLNSVKNEHNAFHIDGDADDENTSGEKDYLMKAINSDPDTVVEFMKQLATNLYQAIDDNMQSSSMRSRYKIYNDKEMDKQYDAYTKQIKEWEDRVSAKEDYYYQKFSKMETALAKLNSQTNTLSGLFGS